ncbi:family with sequence similarity 181 member B [Rhinolophus ferrumequinum]|uniref:Family with sequence similarity 181 member B n=1 Tax=Rhinolophus ferrumequinum TaxID=59479 RepID=A0A671G2G8_RHIFE|nr:protein FAM181B [Rhinolophus ferrumequinum]KAF6333047.1 family with sequence similarity 181 member B [Rhinolophus ferrumequinum]
MAVQAALLSTHPFVPFGFGGSPDGLGGAFGALDKGCCFEDDETGTPAAALLAGTEGGDVREATRDLLSFIDSASSNIKLALDKPGKSKRKVNHRKYLQKQIKRCSGLMGAATPGPPSPGAADTPAKRALTAPSAQTVAIPAHGKAAPRREASQAAAAASLQSRSLAALFDSLRHVPGGAEPAGGSVAAPASRLCGAGAGGAGGDATGPAGGSAVPGSRKVPLRARNLPPSFFTEPSRAGSGGCGPSGPGMSLGDLEKGAETVEFFELLGPDYGAGTEAGVLLAAEPLDVFPTGASVLRGPPELEPGLFEPPPAMVGSLLYPEPWSAPGCPPTKKQSLTAPRGSSTLNEPLRPLYPATADSPSGEDAPGLLASFASFFSDCALPPPPPPHQVSYDYSSGYGRAAYSSLWRPDGAWEGAPGEEGAHRD